MIDDPPPMPHLTEIATGVSAADERWSLRVGGTQANLYTILQIEHPDGRREGGGFGGPTLPPGEIMSVYHGRADRGPLRVVCRAQRGVARLRLELAGPGGITVELSPVHVSTELGVVFFVALLPETEAVHRVVAFDMHGRAIGEQEPRELSG